MITQNLKKVVLAGGAIFMISAAVAQKSNTVNAAMEFQDTQEEFMAQDLEKAKKHILEAKKYIDMSAAHESTATDAKTLKYKGQIYFMLAAIASQLPDDEELKPYANNETINTGLDAMKSAIKYDDKGRYTDEINMFAEQGRIMSLQGGIKMFQDQDFEKAYAMFSSAAKMYSIIGKVDTLANYNAAISAERVNKWEEAAESYKLCAENDYRVPGTYISCSNAYTNAEKPEEAIKIIKAGMEKYPKSKELMIEMANIHLKNNDLESAQGVLNKAIEADPENAQLHFTVGSVYDNLKKYEEADVAYTKALSLDPNNFDANYSMGALKFNQGVEINEKAGDELDQTKYDALAKQADEKFKAALPFLEKAHELNPEDQNTMISLKQLYTRLGMTEKYNEMKLKLQN